MIKKIFSSIIVFAVMIGLLGTTDYIESHYTREGVIIEKENNVLLIEDTCGYLWEYEEEGFKINDTVRMKMDTAHTDNKITDDIILKLEKI